MIAIIAILAALLIPVLSKAKSKAHSIVCLNNLKQLQLTWAIYADDNQDRLVPNNYESLPPNWVAGWLCYENVGLPDFNWHFADNTNVLFLIDGQYARAVRPSGGSLQMSE